MHIADWLFLKAKGDSREMLYAVDTLTELIKDDRVYYPSHSSKQSILKVLQRQHESFARDLSVQAKYEKKKTEMNCKKPKKHNWQTLNRGQKQ
jgi:hypothetical protein